MFWLFTEKEEDEYNFEQIFISSIETVSSDTSIYSTINKINIEEYVEYFDEMSSKKITVSYCIKMKDIYISYTDICTNKIYTFIKELVGQRVDAKGYIMVYKYTKVENSCLPNITKKEYDFYYNMEFDVYKKTTNNQLFVVSNDKYFILNPI